MRKPQVSDGSGVYEELQLNEVLRQREQEEIRQKTEIEVLESAEDYREFCEMRSRMADTDVLVEPDLPEDEMSFVDYKKARELEKRR